MLAALVCMIEHEKLSYVVTINKNLRSNLQEDLYIII